jgi:hypothetical protein
LMWLAVMVLVGLLGASLGGCCWLGDVPIAAWLDGLLGRWAWLARMGWGFRFETRCSGRCGGGSVDQANAVGPEAMPPR